MRWIEFNNSTARVSKRLGLSNNSTARVSKRLDLRTSACLRARYCNLPPIGGNHGGPEKIIGYHSQTR
jgi:hypothetical protein